MSDTVIILCILFCTKHTRMAKKSPWMRHGPGMWPELPLQDHRGRDPKSSRGGARPNVLTAGLHGAPKLCVFLYITLAHEGYGPASSNPYFERPKLAPTRTPGSHHFHFVISSAPPSPSHPATVHPLWLQHPPSVHHTMGLGYWQSRLRPNGLQAAIAPQDAKHVLWVHPC
jgi:hypothetical protein